jgi:hypothetical protein
MIKLNAVETKILFAAAQRQVTILQTRLDKVLDRLAIDGYNRLSLQDEERDLKSKIAKYHGLATDLHHSSELDRDQIHLATDALFEYSKYVRTMASSRAINALEERIYAEMRNQPRADKAAHSG